MSPNRVLEARQLLAHWLGQPRLATRFPLYTGYLESLANAERLQAVHQYLRPLIQDLDGASLGDRIELVDAQCRAISWRGRSAGSMPVPGMPHEYLREVAVPTLLERRDEAPTDHRPFLWLALLPSGHYGADRTDPRQLLQEAHRLAPQDTFIVDRLAAERLDCVWFACHHLPETLLGTVETVRADIAAARSLVALLPQEQRDALESVTLHYEERVNGFVLARRGETPT